LNSAEVDDEDEVEVDVDVDSKKIVARESGVG